jgi:3D (Asp-Asp-Asp) domain-containing protein
MKKLLVLTLGFLFVFALGSFELSATDSVTDEIAKVEMESFDIDVPSTISAEGEVFEISDVETDVTATMYNAVVSQCDADPLITAGMFTIDPEHASEHKWVALSRDLLKRWGGEYDYGDKILIEGAGDKDGVYTIADTMNKRYRNRIDILETEGTPLYKFEDVTIRKLESVS